MTTFYEIVAYLEYSNPQASSLILTRFFAVFLNILDLMSSSLCTTNFAARVSRLAEYLELSSAESDCALAAGEGTVSVRPGRAVLGGVASDSTFLPPHIPNFPGFRNGVRESEE